MKISRPGFCELVGEQLHFADKGQFLLTSRIESSTLGDGCLPEGSPYEHFQVFDHNDRPILIDGKSVIMYRKECHGAKRIKRVYHRGANCWVINSAGELLVPIRSPNKDLYPGMKDNSVSEHNKVSEGYASALIRGFTEELGITVTERDFSLVVKMPVRVDDQWEMVSYYVHYDRSGKFNISPDEIDKVIWLSFKKLKQGGDLVQCWNFRPDHAPALAFFLSTL